MKTLEFVVNLNLEGENIRVGRTQSYHSNLKIVETPVGKVAVFEAHLKVGDQQHESWTTCTVIPGLYRGELPNTPEGLRKLSIELVPDDKKEIIEREVRKAGYEGHINYW